MNQLYIRILGILLFSLFIQQLTGQDPATNSYEPCLRKAELKKLHLPEVKILQLEEKDLPVRHLMVNGIIGQEIRFELLLPMDWNGRFAMGGGGGFVGSIQNSAAFSLSRGFATAGTDTGHQGAGQRTTWAMDHLERQLNFGYMAIHRTAVVSKEIIRRYYCQPSLYNYFLGCSRGGGQAMMEAQRYPEDFDGIVAGAPAFTWPALGVEFIENTKAIYPDGLHKPILSRDELELLESEVLQQCDSLDGLKDGIINDPRRCQINYNLFPMCKFDNQPDCFTGAQIDAIQAVYDGVTLNGQSVYPGFPCGGEGQQGGWFPWIVGSPSDTFDYSKTSLEYRYATAVFKYFVFHDTTWDYRHYDFNRFFEDTRFASSFLDATSTDYSTFQDRGGKMIIYHGWNDAALSALSTIEHYQKASEHDSNLQENIRLFLLPGVLHCARGNGPDQADWLTYIQNWVERNQPPDRVLVSKKQNGKTLMTRPVFPYPGQAVYDGEGDPGAPGSFKRRISEAENE